VLIKKRKAKNSKRGIYLQDKEIPFQPGSRYKYVIDTKNQKLLILPSNDKSDNTVSKRKLKKGEKAVIDIRKKEALSTFEDCDYLQVEIFEDQIVVEGFVEGIEDNSLISKVSNSLKSKFSSKKKTVTDLSVFKKVKKKSRIVFSAMELEKAAGQEALFEQLSLDFSETAYDGSVVYDIQDKLREIKIPLQVVSLFSGAGVFDQGFINENYEIIFALEIDNGAADTYRHNIGNHIVVEDIRSFDKGSIPKAPLMIGGSPCKGFSNSNRYSSFINNPKNRLVLDFIEAVKKNENCQVFVLENVPQILTKWDGAFKEMIYRELGDFEISSGVLNAASMGDPQTRKRAFFIGSKIGRIDLPSPELSPVQFKTVRQAFDGLDLLAPNQLDVSKPKEITLERMRHVPPGGNVMDIPHGLRPSGTHSDMYKRLEWEKPAITIVNPRKAMLLHPEEDRILSARECARLFSLKDNFIFKGGLSSIQEQLGNAVPIKLAQSIAKKVKEKILEFNIRNRKPVMT
jgi:DNA (cytosine-5)-methyltransferase 1